MNNAITHPFHSAEADEWGSAQWIVHPREPDGAYAEGEKSFPGSYRLRKSFTVGDKAVKHAVANVCGLGAYRLYVNGVCADKSFLSPGWSEYLDKLRYDRIEVTRLVSPGTNVVGVQLAPGYGPDWRDYDSAWRAPQRARLHLVIDYADGTSTTIDTDATWEAGIAADVGQASIYQGERRDLRLRDDAWATANGNAEGWLPAKVVAHMGGGMWLNDGTTCREGATLPARRIRHLDDGRYLVDFGENIAGGVRLRAKGASGTVITVRQTEEAMPDFDGLDATSNVGAPQCDEYVLAGRGLEVLEPEWRYSGFRYAEITGWPGKLEPTDVEAFEIHADLSETASFSCSHESLNRLWRAARRSMLGNLQTIPTDTPARCERTCCLMDTHTYWDLAAYCFDIRSYSRWWLGFISRTPLDIKGRPRERQHPLGRLTVGQRGNPDWHGIRIQLPWWLYMAYGDKNLLAQCYQSMRELALFLETTRAKDGICSEGYGDWCSPEAKGGYCPSHVAVTNTALWLHLLEVMEKTAQVLGETDDLAHWKRLRAFVLERFRERFWHPETMTFDEGTQVGGVLALAFGLVPPEERTGVTAALVDRIVSVDHFGMDTGIFGTRYLPHALFDNGEENLWIRMMEEEKELGFGYTFARGATTTWENFTGAGCEGSHNHVMFAGAAEALLTRIAGISPAEPGFKTVAFRPVFPSKLTWAKAELKTVAGTVRIEWRRGGDSIRLNLEVPDGARGRLSLPGRLDEILPPGIHTRICTGAQCGKASR